MNEDNMPSGNYENPYSWDLFQELRAQGNWRGGHVRYEDLVLYYNGNGDQSCDHCDMCTACGCCNGSDQGCGCGCGEGCGCGNEESIVAGTECFRPIEFEVNTYFEISWGDGSFMGGNSPTLTVELVNGDNMRISDVSYRWENSYRVMIFFYIVPRGHSSKDFCNCEYRIPQFYRR